VGQFMKVKIRPSNAFSILMSSSPTLTPIAFLVPVVAGIGSAAVAAVPAVAAEVAAAYVAAYADKTVGTHMREISHSVKTAGGRLLSKTSTTNIHTNDIKNKSLKELIVLANS